MILCAHQDMAFWQQPSTHDENRSFEDCMEGSNRVQTGSKQGWLSYLIASTCGVSNSARSYSALVGLVTWNRRHKWGTNIVAPCCMSILGQQLWKRTCHQEQYLRAWRRWDAWVVPCMYTWCRIQSWYNSERWGSAAIHQSSSNKRHLRLNAQFQNREE